jgi:hypothetical protein
MVNATLETIETEIIQLRDERDKLSKDIDQRVNEKAKNIMQQRNALQKKVARHNEEVSRLEANVREIQYELSKAKRATFMSNKIVKVPNSLLRGYRTSVLAVLLTAAVSICAYLLSGGSTTLFLTTMITFVIGLSTYFLLLLRRRLKFDRRYEMGFGRERSFLVPELSDLLAEWLPSKREDFLFQLMRLGEKVSPEELADTSRYLSRKYGERESQDRRLESVNRKIDDYKR